MYVTPPIDPCLGRSSGPLAAVNRPYRMLPTAGWSTMTGPANGVRVAMLPPFPIRRWVPGAVPNGNERRGPGRLGYGLVQVGCVVGAKAPAPDGTRPPVMPPMV